MQIVSRNLDILCSDSNGNKIAVLCYNDYEENYDEIKVRTPLFTTELTRGWIGNLSYRTLHNQEVIDGYNTDTSVYKEYNDVLLAKVDVWSSDKDGVIWQYTFLKK